MQRYLPVLILLLFATGMVYPPGTVSGQSYDNSVFRFLQLTSSARAAALGGSHVAVPEADVSFFAINPAYVHEGLHRNFSVNYLNHIGDINMGFANGAWHLNAIGTLGVSIRYVNYGEFQRTDESGLQQGEFGASDLALTTGLAREVLPGLRVGASTTFIYSSYDQYTSTAIALNAGIRFHWEDTGFDIGASVNNLGTQLSTFDGTTEALPLDIRVGLSRRLEHIPIRFFLTAHSLNRWELETFNDEDDPGFLGHFSRHFLFGAELLLSENVHLRAGYDHLQHQHLKISNRLDSAGFGFGLGIKYRGLTFDFSHNSFSELGGVTRIGIQTFL